MEAWRQFISKLKSGPKPVGRVALYSGRARTAAVACCLVDGRPQLEASPLFGGDTALDQAFAWRRGLKGAWASSLVLHPSKYHTVQIDAPKVALEERRDAVRWQLKDQVEFSVDEASIDLITMPGPTPGSLSDRLIAVAAPAESISSWMAVYRDQRCTLDTIDIPEMAMRNLAVLAAGDTAVALMHIGLSVTRMTIVWQGELCAFRQIELPARQLLDANASDREAMLDRLALDIQRTVDAFVRQFHGADLNKLLLSSMVLADEVQARLTEMTGMNIQAFRAEDHLAWRCDGPVYDFEQDRDYTIAIGAALRPPGQ